ncbi:unnamed protein product [Toxocara canis]|uniref:Methyltransferase-like protein 13 n=1 Tax=Toxocara canis TaxID=6265 RepID=A0A3P7GEA7_TOXCA|nr:unnamed protein product [Toxocara canis]
MSCFSFTIERQLSADKFDSFVVASAALKVPQPFDQRHNVDSRNLSVDFSVVVHPYARVMIVSALASGVLRDPTKNYNVLSVGLGTGVVNGFLHDKFDNVNITVVELKKQMFEMARNYYGLILDGRQRVIVEDGLQFLREHLRSGGAPFDLIFVDACHNERRDHLICPVEAFLEKDNVKLLHNALIGNGTLVVSLLILPLQLAEQYTKPIREEFEQCVILSDANLSANQVLVCGRQVPDKEKLNSEVMVALEKLGLNNYSYDREDFA